MKKAVKKEGLNRFGTQMGSAVGFGSQGIDFTAITELLIDDGTLTEQDDEGGDNDFIPCEDLGNHDLGNCHTISWHAMIAATDPFELLYGEHAAEIQQALSIRVEEFDFQDDEDEYSSPNDGWEFDEDADLYYNTDNEILAEDASRDDAPVDAEYYTGPTLQHSPQYERVYNEAKSYACIFNPHSRRGHGRTADVRWKIHAGNRHNRRRTIRHAECYDYYATTWGVEVLRDSYYEVA
jgi:hypothetical protein